MCSVVAEGRTAHPRDRRHKALESVLEALDMGDISFPSTKANPFEAEAFYAEILAMLAGRLAEQKLGSNQLLYPTVQGWR